MAKKVAKKKVAKKKAATTQTADNGEKKKVGRKVSDKSIWIAEQLKTGATPSAIAKEGTEKFGSKVYQPMVYRIRKKMQEAGELE